MSVCACVCVCVCAVHKHEHVILFILVTLILKLNCVKSEPTHSGQIAERLVLSGSVASHDHRQTLGSVYAGPHMLRIAPSQRYSSLTFFTMYFFL